MRPEEFIAQRFLLQPLSFSPTISLYLPTISSGLAAWLEAEAHPTPPYWAYAWAGGIALALHLQAHPELVANKTVLDFGSGSGLVGIVAAKLGAAAVFALEPDPVGAIATRLNAAANNVVITPVTTLLHTDIALAGDVFYNANIAASVLPQLQELAATGTSVLIGDPHRKTLPRHALAEIASYDVPDMGARTPVPTGVFNLA